jgi:two-component sensor histidine kinase
VTLSDALSTTESRTPADTLFGQAFFAAPRPLLLIAVDPPRFTMAAVNAAHAQVFNTTREALTGFGVFEVFGPDPTPEAKAFMDAIRASFDEVVAKRRPHQMGVARLSVRSGEQNEERYWSAMNAPIADAIGRITHIVSAVTDITGEVLERRSEEARRLLAREVDHRSRNALAVVQTFVRLTAADDIESFRARLDERISALARAQGSLAARRWEGALLSEVVAAELCAISDAGRFRASGPAIDLPPEQVQAMSMVIHELATNASKYGCLATPGGSLAVIWSGTADEFELTWRESGCAEPKPPLKQGFGSRLIAQLASQLGGAVSYDWRPEGVTVRFQLRPGRGSGA